MLSWLETLPLDLLRAGMLVCDPMNAGGGGGGSGDKVPVDLPDISATTTAAGEAAPLTLALALFFGVGVWMFRRWSAPAAGAVVGVDHADADVLRTAAAV